MQDRLEALARVTKKNFKKLKTYRLQTGFTMLEAVVVVGVLLALAVGGFFSYGTITQNAKIAAAKSAASSVYTAILVAEADGDPNTNATQVIDQFNANNDKFYAEIIETEIEAIMPAMFTAAKPTSKNDPCVRITSKKANEKLAESGKCPAAGSGAGAPAPTPSDTSTPTETATTPTPTPTATPTITPTPTPTPTPAPANGGGYTAAWGDNAAGPFGNNSTTRALTPVPSMISTEIQGKRVTAVAAGPSHSCAIADGTAYCAGSGGNGRLGNGSDLSSLTPVAVTGPLTGKTVTAISAGSNHSCAVADGVAYCWGFNSAGQLGNGTAINTNIPTAVKADGVLAGKTVTAITSGGHHTCVLANEQVFCWGYNARGQLGNGSTASFVNVPVAVTGLMAGKKATFVANGWNHSCAIADDKVYCWGENGFGQIGSSYLATSSTPLAVGTAGDMAGKTVTSLSAGGEYHSCAIAEGKAYCWGHGTNGELGNGLTNRSNNPVAVSTDGVLAGKTVTSIATGKLFTCAVADGKGYCWGSNSIGQGGYTSGTTSNVPVAVEDNGVLSGKTLISVASSENYTAAIYS